MPAAPPASSAGPSASTAASTSNTHSRTSSNTTATPQVDPQLTIQIPISQSQQTPRPDRHAQRNNSRDERTNSFAWQQSLTPIATNSATSASLASPFDESHMRTDHPDRAFFSPYTSAPGPFSPTPDVTSPITSFHSPPGHSSSPDIPYTQPHNSPQQKSFHPPPPIITSPTKKARTSTSPTQPPPMSPFIYTRHPMTSAPQLTASLAEAIDFINTPVTSAPISLAESYMDLPATTSVGMNSNTVMRRVSVENLLAAPLSHDGFSGGYDDRYDIGFKTEDVSQYNSNGQGLEEDDDIEEIPRDNYEDGDFNMQVNKARQFFKLNSAYPDQMSIPRRLDPLPQWLLSNEQNKMYFHHYLKHTARLLVPHDCSENPFKHILPQSVYLLSLRIVDSVRLANLYYSV